LIPPDAGFGFYITTIVAFTAGGVFLMWVGELITEYGVSNGISLLIMAGIVARMPSVVIGMLNPDDPAMAPQTVQVILFFVLFVAIVLAVTLVQEGQRRIPIQQARHVRGPRVYGGQRSHMPIRVNQAGVMPVIFASSLMIFPSVILDRLGLLGSFGGLMSPSSWTHVVLYVAMIYFFSYFWNSLMFQPAEIAKNMKEHGSFIPGIRPGARTADFLERVMNRVTYVGAGFLAFIALLPNILMATMGLSTRAEQEVAFFLGGTGILIVVAVVLEFIQKVESHLMMRSYRGFIKDRGSRGRRR
jgi:preprotein translocase subunit SecY